MIEEDRMIFASLVGSAVVMTAIGTYAYFSHRKNEKTLAKILKDREEFRIAHEVRMKKLKEHLDRSTERHNERLQAIIQPLRDQGLIE